MGALPRNPDTDGHRGTDPEIGCRDTPQDPLEDSINVSRGLIDKRQKKLLPSPSEEKILAAQLCHHDSGKLFEHLVAAVVPVGVIDVLEMVDIEHREMDIPFLLQRSDPPFKGTASQSPG